MIGPAGKWLVENWRAVLVSGLIFLCMGFAMSANSYKASAEQQKKRANEAQSLADARKETIDDMQRRQKSVAALDAKYMKEVANAKAENDALQLKLDDGGRVLVKGSCPKPAATTSSVADGTTVELSQVAGRNVLGIRAGIRSDQSKINALQQYITEQCLK